MSIETPTWLRHQLLIAMPQLDDPNFHQTVTWLFEHNEDGAMGVIINRPIDVSLQEMFEQLDIGGPALAQGEPGHHRVVNGGPVQANRGFVLHRTSEALPQWNHCVHFPNGVTLATSRDVLQAIADGAGPAASIIALGYAGWSAGQLERELAENAWLAAPADLDILFDLPFDQRWSAARRIGVDIALISQGKPGMPEAAADITVLGFDFGTKRIGVAIGNTLTGTARPLAVLPARDGVPDWDQLKKLVDEWKPARLLVGLPLNMDGTESELSTRARSFGRKLQGRLVLPVDVVDERLSSFEARGELMRSEHRRGKPAVDALAASLIVEQWLATQGAT